MKKQNGGKYPLNISTEFGALDWRGVGMALREFISNAYDWADRNDVNITETETARAKDGLIQLYIPMTYKVRDYYEKRARYFLMVDPSYNPDQVVITKPTYDELSPARF